MLFPAQSPPKSLEHHLHPGFPELVKGNQKLLESGRGADFTVTCGSQQWKLHQAIVCSRSHFFVGALESGFKESETRNITIDHEDPALICRMLKYLYLFDYSQNAEDVIPGVEDLHPSWKANLSASLFKTQNPLHKLEINARMYILADRYGIISLKKVAEEKFWTSRFSREILSGEHKILIPGPELDITYFVDLMAFIWGNTPTADDRLRLHALGILSDVRSGINWRGELERLASISPECAGALMDFLYRQMIAAMEE